MLNHFCCCFFVKITYTINNISLDFKLTSCSILWFWLWNGVTYSSLWRSYERLFSFAHCRFNSIFAACYITLPKRLWHERCLIALLLKRTLQKVWICSPFTPTNVSVKYNGGACVQCKRRLLRWKISWQCHTSNSPEPRANNTTALFFWIIIISFLTQCDVHNVHTNIPFLRSQAGIIVLSDLASFMCTEFRLCAVRSCKTLLLYLTLAMAFLHKVLKMLNSCKTIYYICPCLEHSCSHGYCHCCLICLLNSVIIATHTVPFTISWTKYLHRVTINTA